MDDDVDGAPAPQFNFARAMRELDGEEISLRTIYEELFSAEHHTKALSRRASLAVACASSDVSWPADDEDARLRVEIFEARERRRDDWLRLAAKMIEARRILIASGFESLLLADALMEDIPPTWHNFDVYTLARELARKGHGIARGSVPGWRA